MDPDVYSASCPSRGVLDLVASKWTALIVGSIADGPMRYGELQRTIDGISTKMLTQKLRALERDGLVTRTVYAEIPPRTDYRLTELGRSLIAPMKAVRDWSESNADAVGEARTSPREEP